VHFSVINKVTAWVRVHLGKPNSLYAT